MIDVEYARLQIIGRLPVRTRWLIGETPWDTDLTRSSRPLQPLQSCELNDGIVDQRWASVYLFGEQDYAEGGGANPFLGVEVHTGKVVGLDIERGGPSALYFLNSDMECFIRTFCILETQLRPGSAPSATLLSMLAAADPRGYERSEWRIMVADPPAA